MLNPQNQDTETIGDKYILLKKNILGFGAFSKVYEGFVKDKVEEKVAIKVFNSQSCETTDLLYEKLRALYNREILMHKMINNKNVVKMIEDVNCNQMTYLILELCEEGNLNRLLNQKKKRQLDQEDAFYIFSQIVDGYNSIYENNAFHRDLKPENILFTKGIVKIADLGLAKLVKEISLPNDHTIVGTLLYQAPEMMVSSKYTYKVDIWSLGIIFYEMLFGVVPYVENHPKKLYQKITTEPLIFPQDTKINQHYLYLIKKMLKVDPEMRIKWEDLLQCIEKIKKQKTNKIKDYFLYISKLIAFFHNNTTKFFFQLQPKLKLSQTLQILFNVTSTKQLLNEFNCQLQILEGEIPYSVENSNNSLKESNIKIFRNNKVIFQNVLNYFKTQYEQMNQLYTDNCLKQFNEIVKDQTNNSISNNSHSELIKAVNQIVQTNIENNITDNFQKIYIYFINQISQSIQQQQIDDDETLRQIYTLQINMFYSLRPQNFEKKLFEPSNLEEEIKVSSTQQLKNKVFNLSMTYSK
ncbi:unnamed protein product [Paramecium sonneborni]|uniref:Protein kinase domain-containing protein n=1 Tax=Paramecium sonneborni TaxID=65129 RepID=A0A8S1RH67_9CILI|nr:unnamed protein product [Paramecium sonneborni]